MPPKKLENWPRATIGITKSDRAKIQLLQKEWGWSYDDIFEYAVRAGLKTMDPGRFPTEER